MLVLYDELAGLHGVRAVVVPLAVAHRIRDPLRPHLQRQPCPGGHPDHRTSGQPSKLQYIGGVSFKNKLFSEMVLVGLTGHLVM